MFRGERRPVLTDPEVLEALAHPVRLDLLAYLASDGPATASQCARAVGDTPSNCSYHLRALARAGLVESVASDDRRTRPWRATVTGFDIDTTTDPESRAGRASAAVMSAALALEQRRMRDFLSRRDALAPAWRRVLGSSRYTLRASPEEIARLDEQIDGLLRPFLAATRTDAPSDAALVQAGVYAITSGPWNDPER